MNSQTLAVAAMNERHEHKRFVFLIKQLRAAIDCTAGRVARENAAWHDDPDAEDHAAFHAPAIEQFPRETRDRAVLELVRHYLTEITLSEAVQP